MVLFKDFYKPVKNLFTNNYQEENFTFKSKTKPNKNLELNFETKREKGKDYASKLSWTGNFKVSDASVKVEGEILQKGEVTDKVTIKGLYDGLTVDGSIKLLTDRNEKDTKKEDKSAEDKTSRDTATLGITYNHKHADLNLALTKKNLNPFLLGAGVALKYEDFSFGGDFELELEKEEKEEKKDEKKEEKKDEKKEEKKEEEKKKETPLFKKYNFGATYQTENLLLAALVENSLSTAKLGVTHNVDKETTLGFEFAHNLKKSEPFNVTAGFSRKLDEQSNLRAKLLSSGVGSVAYQVKVKPELTATVSLEMSFKELSNIGKVGFELAFEPLD